MRRDEILKVIKSLSEIIKRDYHAEVVGLFGSFARGEEKASSDIDVLVMFDDEASLFDLVGLADFLEEQFHIKVDIVPIDALREEIKEYVLSEAMYV